MKRSHYNHLLTRTLLNESLAHVHAFSWKYVVDKRQALAPSKIELKGHPNDLVSLAILESVLDKFKIELTRIQDHEEPSDDLFAKLQKLESCITNYSQLFAFGRELLITAHAYLMCVREEFFGTSREYDLALAFERISILTVELDKLLHQSQVRSHNSNLIRELIQFSDSVHSLRPANADPFKQLKFTTILEGLTQASGRVELLALTGDL